MISRKPLESRTAERIGHVHAALVVCLLAILGLFLDGATPPSNNSKVFVAGLGLPAAIDTFAVDDFDGDLVPDIATVQPVSDNSSGTNYIVQLQFGSGERRSIRFAAHRGPVRIVASDVNGDQISDLIISSAWTGEPYAVLISDGHGAFSTVDPSSIQAFPRKSKPRLSWPRPSPSETAATSPRSAERGFAKTKCIRHSRPTKGLAHRPNSVYVRCPLLVSLPGHAPPRSALL